MRTLFFGAWLVGFAALVACGTTNSADPGGPGGPDSGPSTITGAIPCDVDAILETNCRKCHSAEPQYGAPMPLVTFGDLHAPSKSDPNKQVYELIAGKIASDVEPMPPPPNERLSADARATLTAWTNGGAVSANGTGCGVVAQDGGPDPGITCSPDLQIGPGSVYEMPAGAGDEYVCYGVDITRPSPTHIVAFSPRIDNTKIVHHIVLFETTSSYGTTPRPCSAGASLQWRMVMGWAPGGKGLELPPDVGFPISPSGTHYVVQMHYSNPQALTGQKDTSGFSFCTAAPRTYEADVLAFGTQDIHMSAPGPYKKDCSITVPSSLVDKHFIASMPHMHKLGTAMSTTLTPKAGGPDVDLGTMANFSFNTQAWLPLDGVTKEGDTIRTVCEYNNTTGGPVNFGENTADEMCYSFTMYYPKVASFVWSWALPSITSTCQ